MSPAVATDRAIRPAAAAERAATRARHGRTDRDGTPQGARTMKIWVDADACPNAIKAILFRAAERLHIDTVLVANHHVRVPPSPYLSSVQVPGGFDVADNAIVANMAPGDLVVTADVPLAAEVVKLGATALNPRGTLYDKENVHDLLARRNLSEQLRESGAITSSASALGRTDLQAFANQLDRYLTARRD
jgi:uncharacterized protein